MKIKASKMSKSKFYQASQHPNNPKPTLRIHAIQKSAILLSISNVRCLKAVDTFEHPQGSETVSSKGWSALPSCLCFNFTLFFQELRPLSTIATVFAVDPFQA